MSHPDPRRIVVALGGNALLRRGETLTPETQQRNLEIAGSVIVPLARDRELVVTHGTGPQVGLLAMRAEFASGPWHESLDVIGAETDGMIGYLLARELGNRLPDRPVATVLTQVEVDAGDPAWSRPTKPIGGVLSEGDATRMAELRGWQIAEEPAGWRRVVSSPEPKRILEVESVRLLAEAGHVVVAAGGGGVPVVRGGDGRLDGAEAVVDKDLTAALLATQLEADLLILLTDTPFIFRDWPSSAQPIRRITPTELRAMGLAEGSMGPKAEAAARFVEATGGRAVIGAMEDAQQLLAGDTGTRIVPD